MRNALIGVSFLLLLLASAEATSVKRLNLDDLVRGADLVLAGTVKSVAARAEEDNARFPVWTDVVLERLEVVKGTAGSTVEVSMVGGTVGDRRVKVAGMPALERGKRYLLFLRTGRKWICPFVGWRQGVFRLVPTPTSVSDLVETCGGKPVRDLGGGRVNLVAPGEKDPARLTWDRMKADLESRVRRQVAEEREKRARQGEKR